MKRGYSSKLRFLQNHSRKLIRIADKALAKGNLQQDEQRAKLERRTERVRRILADDVEDITEEQFDRTIRKLEKVLIVNEIWSPKSYFREIVEAFVVAAVIAIFVRSFVAEPFKIPTGSMIPTLEIDDFIFVTKFDYGLRLPFSQTRIMQGGIPERGDVIVFDFPGEGEDKGKNFIKRVVAIPGDRVSIVNNALHRNGKPIARELLTTKQPCSDGKGNYTSCLCDLYEEQLGSTQYLAQNHSPSQNNPMCINSADWPMHRPGAGSNLEFGPLSFSPNSPEVIVPDVSAFCMFSLKHWSFLTFQSKNLE